MGLEDLRGDDPRITAAREAFIRWTSCRHSNDYPTVEIEVNRAKEGVKYVIASGMCDFHDRRVDFAEKCVKDENSLGGSCYQGRRGPRHKKTAIQKIRTKKALGERQRRKERARDVAHLQKSINQFGEDEDNEGPPAC